MTRKTTDDDDNHRFSNVEQRKYNAESPQHRVNRLQLRAVGECNRGLALS
jgi:hypothetical protein